MAAPAARFAPSAWGPTPAGVRRVRVPARRVSCHIQCHSEWVTGKLAGSESAARQERRRHPSLDSSHASLSDADFESDELVVTVDSEIAVPVSLWPGPDSGMLDRKKLPELFEVTGGAGAEPASEFRARRRLRESEAVERVRADSESGFSGGLARRVLPSLGRLGSRDMAGCRFTR